MRFVNDENYTEMLFSAESVWLEICVVSVICSLWASPHGALIQDTTADYTTKIRQIPDGTVRSVEIPHRTGLDTDAM